MRARRTRQVAALRPSYQRDLAEGTDRFFEPRRSSCPWCGDNRLRVRLRTTDRFQHKPGRFELDQCACCGHIFQNPRLNGAGLEFYYRDFYDGLGEQQLDGIFNSGGKQYSGRARLLAAHARPGTLLDIGTGHGHFPHAAKDLLPDTTFHGLDLSDGVEIAQERGWIDRGYRGLLTDLVGDLAGQYDAVTMFHYLEHTTDPLGELEAASETLRTGGHLLIEVPDPECRYGRLLGRWWMPWFQPQHLNFVSIGNLTEYLAELGFTVVAEQRAAAHIPVDLAFAAWIALDSVAPRGDQPWFARARNTPHRVARIATVLAGLPVILLGVVLDQLIRPFAGRLGLSNAYRVLARRDG